MHRQASFLPITTCITTNWALRLRFLGLTKPCERDDFRQPAADLCAIHAAVELLHLHRGVPADRARYEVVDLGRAAKILETFAA